MKKIAGGVLALFTLALVLSSCNSNDTSNPQTGFFLVANVSPDAPHLDLRVNNTDLVDTGLAFGTYTPYYSANAGTYNFALYPAGSSTPALDDNVTIAPNKVYSYFVIDSFSSVKSTVVEDAVIAPSGDSVLVRFFNFCPNLPQAVSLVDSVGGPLFSNRTFNDQASNSAYATFIEMPAGNYTLQLKLSDGTLLWRNAGNLEGGKVYTLFAQGFYNGTGVQAFGLGQIINYAP